MCCIVKFDQSHKSTYKNPLNSVIIFRKRHNISERFYFGTRKHSEVEGISVWEAIFLPAGTPALCHL